MFDLDFSTAKIFRNMAGLGICLFVLATDLFIIYKSWRAIFLKLKGVDLMIQILAVFGALLATAALLILTFWLLIILLVRVSGMSSIH